MKRIVRLFAVEFFGLWVANKIATGLVFQDQLLGMAVTAGALAVATTLIKPVVNLLLLPLTLATLGLLKFLGHTITLYIVDLALDQFKVTGFHFAGLSSPYLDLPPVSYDSQVMAYIAFSIVISVVTGLVHWLMK